MSGVNKAILIGRLGSDPDSRYTQTGKACTNFGLATNEYFGGQERTEWHRIVTFGKLAEICRDNLSKGRQVYVEGRIQHRQFVDREGSKRWITEIVANVVKFLSPKQGNGTTTNDAPAEQPPADADDSGLQYSDDQPVDDALASDTDQPQEG